MAQATVNDTDLAGALYAVVLRLSRLPVDEPVDKAGLAVLHEMRRLGTVRPSDLAAEMRLDLSTISRHLQSLEQQGMVQRTADPDDARAQRISVTKRGAEVLVRVMGHRAATIGDAISHWSAGDRSALGHLLKRLADDLPQGAGSCSAAVADEPARTHKMREKS